MTSETTSSARIQLRVLHALILREVLTRYGRHNIGFLWLFAEPMLFTLGVAALWYATNATHGSSIPIIGFAITGYSSVLLWRNMPARCIGALGPNLALMYHRNVRVFDIYISRLIVEISGTTISFVCLTVVAVALGGISLPESLMKVLIGWALLAWFGCSLAIAVGTLSEQSEFIEKLWHPTSYLLFPLSGAVFLVQWLPHKARDFVLMLPMVHCVELIRDGFFGSLMQAHYSVAYVITVNLVLTLMALTQVRVVGRQVIPR